MNAKKIVSILIAGTMCISMFTACAGKAPDTATSPASQVPEATGEQTPAEKPLEGSITWATNRTDIADTTLTEMAEEFMALHPGTKVEVEGIKDVEQTMMTRMAADEMPDVSIIISSKLTAADFANYFLPIDDLGYTPDNIYFYQNCLGTDGKLYGLTPDMYTNCVFYSKPAFKKAGIEKPPTTMDELLAACEKLKGADVIPFGTSFRDFWPLRGWFSGFYTPIGQSGNVNFVDELVTAEKLFDDSEYGNLQYLKMAKGFADKGYFEPELAAAGWDNMRRDILAGDIAMFYDGAWYGPSLVDTAGMPPEDVGAFPFPGSKALTVCPSWFYGVSKNTKNPEVAKAFLKFMIDDGRYIQTTKAECSLKSYKSDLPGIAELYSYNLPVIEMPVINSELIEIFNKAQFNLDGIAQEYILSDKPDEVAAKYNEKWAQAKAALGK